MIKLRFSSAFLALLTQNQIKTKLLLAFCLFFFSSSRSSLRSVALSRAKEKKKSKENFFLGQKQKKILTAIKLERK